MEIITLILVGAVAGWVASKVMRVDSSPLINILLGIAGGMLGGYLLGLINISLLDGIPGDILVSIIGAIILVFVYKLISK
jgi:uncharacterized membrane protein YeaQ/YmgE (transglycosylase-associated protein family)